MSLTGNTKSNQVATGIVSTYQAVRGKSLKLPEKGDKGDPGVDGGYYTPSVEQVNDSTMRISFAASKEEMPVVEDLNIALLPGKNGADGISPVVAVEDIDGGHRVTITDKNGAKQFDVMDGTVTEEQIASAVEDYMAEHPADGNANYNPVAKTEDMTQPVGVDADGRLWVAPIGGGDTPVIPGTHGIVWDLVNVMSSNNVASVSDGASLYAVLTPADGYTLGDVTITMGGEVLSGAWNADTATVTIPNVTGDVIISCAGVERVGPVDTSPVAEHDDYKTYKGGLIARQGMFVTVKYPIDFTHSTIREIKYYFARNAESNVQSSVECYNGDTYVLQWTQQWDTETTIVPDVSGTVIYDSIRFNVLKSTETTCYAYFADTGEVIFAGKDSQYYGMANIDGTMKSDVSTTLSVDDDYAMDYGVVAASLSTNVTPYTKVDIDPAWAGVIEEAKNAWMLEANSNVDKIPLIIHTDQHGGASNVLFKFMSEIVNWYDISKVVNLGDTVNSWSDADADNPYTACKALEYYLKTMEKVPYSKRIEIYGNHDYGSTSPQPFLRKYFRNINARCKDNYGNFVVKDDYYNVKYVIVSGFAMDESLGGWTHYIIYPDSLRWIISELEKVDGYDVVILSHVPLEGVNAVSLNALWSGRKAKTSGSVTDEYGNTYNFDFTDCDGELLCGLHGHEHDDGHTYIGELLDAWFDAWYISPNAFYFVLVDRENRQLNVWKVDNTPQYQNYQIPMDKPTE